MPKSHSPATVAKEQGSYTHAIEIAANARWLHISGQVGVGPDGVTGQGIEAQSDLVFRNIVALLADAGMAFADIVKLTIYVTDPRHIPAVRTARDRVRGDHKPASTLVVVSALASPEWMVEVEAVAAKEG